MARLLALSTSTAAAIANAGAALMGCVQQIWLTKNARMASLIIYILVGWLAMVAVMPPWHALTPAGFAWLATGYAC